MLRKKRDKREEPMREETTWDKIRKVISACTVPFKVVLGALATLLLIVIICGFTFMGTLGDYLRDDVLPEAYVDLENYSLEQNSYLYYVDSDGHIQEYQKVFAETSSRWAAIEEIPKDLINAAIAIEDHRFMEHQGVDWVTTVKATARMFFGNSSAGGSSITQQLTKNILLKDDDSADDVTVRRKVLEIFRAIQLEREYDKNEIMEMYLNVIYLGQGCRGVRSAAATYFGKELEMLTTAECASLISITNNPSLFDPYSDNVFEYNGQMTNGMQRNQIRQRLVLGEMLAYGFITQDEYDKAVAQELVLKNGISDEDKLAKCPNEACGQLNTVKDLKVDGEAYFCPKCNTQTVVTKSASQDNYSWFTDAVLRDVAQALAKQAGVTWNDNTELMYMRQIQNGGYHIYTTLDKDVQDQIDLVYGNLDQIPNTRGGQQLQSAIVIVDNRTGDIVGLAGGVGEKTGYLDYCRATMARLQSGSSIKPITVYAPGFEAGVISPATVIDDLPLSYGQVGSGAYPRNDTRTYSYSRTIYDAVEDSVNAVAAQTLMKIGMNYSYDFATQKFHLSTLIKSYVDSTGYEHSDIAVGPLALGAQTWGVHVREMADAFGTFANNGVYRQGRTFTKVYDSNGKLVLDNTQVSEQILSTKSVNYMNYCLVAGTRSGTGTEANLSRTIGITTAGKTGTSGDNKDKWYCGFTGYYTAAVWCGFDDPETIYTTSCGNPAAVLFRKVMTPIHSGKSNKELYSTDSMRYVSVCLDSGLLATEACGADVRTVDLKRVGSAMAYSEDIPGKYCNKHVMVDYCSGGGVATEYCKKFAEVDANVKIEKRALVRFTQNELNEIAAANSYGLNKNFYRDDYIYLIDGNGNDGAFKGFKGDKNADVTAPYIVCPEHTEKSWKAYEDAKKLEEESKNEPTDPSAPSDGLLPVTP